MPKRPKRTRGQRNGTPQSTARAAANDAQIPSSPPGVVRTIVVPSTIAQNEFGRVFDRATAGTDVAISKHSVVRAFLVSAERYQQLTRHRAIDMDALSSRFEALYASMQSPRVRSGTDRALRAKPAEMGKAAVAAAQRSRGPSARAAKRRGDRA